MPVNLAFIVFTDRQKVDPETRKLIRSHVMRGKNRIKTRRKPRDLVHGDEPKEALSLIGKSGLACPLTVPRLPCSEFSTVRFADDVEPARIADILSFVSTFPKAIYQLNRCIASETTATTQAWFSPLFFDPAYLYTMCFTVETYFDGLLGRTRNAEARRRDNIYYAKAIRILQDRLALNDDSIKLSDSTIMTVLGLSGHAYTTGDYDSAKDHTDGLLQLAKMRGMKNLAGEKKIMIEIIRSDLCAAIDNGTRPVLFTRDSIPWSLLLHTFPLDLSPTEISSSDYSPSCIEVCDFTNRLDPELAAICAAMSEFCLLANTAAEQGGTKVTEGLFLHSMGSTLYRLLFQRFEIGSLDEAFRLGLLAFASPIYLHWNRVELPDPRFNATYRKALAALKLRASTDVAPKEWTWLLTIATLSMFHEPDSCAWFIPWLQKNMLLCNISTWTHMRDLLGSFMWVGVVYDEQGKEIFDSLLPQ